MHGSLQRTCVAAFSVVMTHSLCACVSQPHSSRPIRLASVDSAAMIGPPVPRELASADPERCRGPGACLTSWRHHHPYLAQLADGAVLAAASWGAYRLAWRNHGSDKPPNYDIGPGNPNDLRFGCSNPPPGLSPRLLSGFGC